MSRIRVLLVDDHPVLLDGLATLLEVNNPEIEVISTASNGTIALQICEKQSVDVVVMDIRMPGMNGIETTAQLRQRYPQTKVIALTTFDDEEYVVGVLQAGANGYLLKHMPLQEIAKAIHTVYEGGVLLEPGVASKVFQRLTGGGTPSHTSESITTVASKPMSIEESLAELSQRDRELLQLLAQGKDSKSIAQTLYLNEHTIRNYMSRLYERIGVKDRAQAALWAVEHGYAANK